VCFMGLSLNTYLAAAHRVGLAPFDPSELVAPADAAGMDPSELLVVTTGSQAEPRAALALAAAGASPTLKLGPSDLVLYSAKVIPGNEPRVAAMMNAVAARGATIAQGRDAGLHSSGHACRGELEEVLRLVRPHHFLPVHGEFSFLCEHADLARSLGVKNTSVIRNGQMLGVSPTGSANKVASSGLVGGGGGGGGRPAYGPPGPNGEASFAASVLGTAQLTLFYNDGHRGTGTAGEMAIDERSRLATEGVVIAAVDVLCGPPPPPPPPAAAAAATPASSASTSSAGEPGGRLRARVRVTTRAMWTDEGRLLARFVRAAEAAVGRLPSDALVVAVERVVAEALRREARIYNARRPEVVVIAHEYDPRAAARAGQRGGGGGGERGGARGGDRERGRGAPVNVDRRGRVGTGNAAPVDEEQLMVEEAAAAAARGERAGRGGRGGRGAGRGGARGPPPAVPVPDGLIKRRRAANPRENPADAAAKGLDVEYG